MRKTSRHFGFGPSFIFILAFCLIPSLFESYADLVPDKASARDNDASFICEFDAKEPVDSCPVLAPEDGKWTFEKIHPKAIPGKFGNALFLVPGSEIKFDSSAAILQAEQFRLSFWLSCGFRNAKDGIPLQISIPLKDGSKDAGVVQVKVVPCPRNWEFSSTQTWHLEFQVSSGGKGASAFEKLQCAIEDWKEGDWHHVAVLYSAGGKNDGGKTSKPLMRLYVDGACVAMSQRAPALTGAGESISLQSKADSQAICSIDDLRIDGSARAFTARSAGWEGFLPGNGLGKCRTDLPLYFYFSQPMDRKFGGISIFDKTDGRSLEDGTGKFVGDGSVYKLEFKKPLPFGHIFKVQFPPDDKALRTIDGILFKPSSIPEQTFSTRKRGEPPRPLDIMFRNDNLHASLEGTLRMLKSGIDIVEINPVKLKDAWVSNHCKGRSGELPPNLKAGEGGDQKALDDMPAPLEETPYSAYDKINFCKSPGGKPEVIGRLDEQIGMINNWDRLMEIQGYSDVPEEEYRRLYENGGLRWEKVLAYHGPAACCYGKPRTQWAHSNASPHAKNWLAGLATYLPGILEENDPLFPDGITPAYVVNAKKNGKMLWMYAFSNRNEGTLTMAARLGLDVYVPDNDMAFLGSKRNREVIYRLNSYEDAKAPTVTGISLDGNNPSIKSYPLDSSGIKIEFSCPMEARSVNYDSVRLTKENAPEPRVAMSITADAQKRTFTLKPLKSLEINTGYMLSIGYDAEPRSLNGMELQTRKTMIFSTAKEK